MHVLMTADTVGGVWTYTRERVTGLLCRGHRVTLVSFGGYPSPEQMAWMQGLKAFAYYPTAYRLEWMQNSADDIDRSAAWLKALLAELNPDLLHFNQYAYGSFPTQIPKVVVAHSDVVSWWVHALDQEPPDDTWLRWYRNLVNQGLASADMVIAPSQWMLETLKDYYVSPRKSQVIYNSRDAALFDRSAPKQDCVVTVGRLWDQAKQVSLLTQHRHPVPIYIAGPAGHPEKLSGGSEEMHEEPYIKWLGPQTCQQLRTLYANASIYAGTSRYEPFGLAPLEAALSGCALLLNDIPTFRELWGDAACYFERNNADSLAAEVKKLIENPDLRERFATRALERAIHAFCPDRMLDSYERVYNSLVTQEAYA